MTDLSEFVAQNTTWRAPCVVGVTLDGLDPARAASLRAALAESKESIQHVAISRVLKKWEIDIPPQTIGRHRDGGCGCDR